MGIYSPTIERTALLCKADLVTKLVFEFTELQGYIGADYALRSGEDKEVAEGIKEHYFQLLLYLPKARKSPVLTTLSV